MPKYSIVVEEKTLVSYEVEAPDLLTARYQVLIGQASNTRVVLPYGYDTNFVDEREVPAYTAVVDLEDE